jgi:uncharacterized membrane protein YidH (DUF202 family)
MSSATQPVLPTWAIMRTRMSWIRTCLAVIVTGFLLVRGGFTGAESPVLAVLAGLLTVLVVATSLTRFTYLGKLSPHVLTRAVVIAIAGGILALVVIALVRLLMTA